jgi:hypothetical protein
LCFCFAICWHARCFFHSCYYSYSDSKEICTRMSAGKWHGDTSNFKSNVSIYFQPLARIPRITEKCITFDRAHPFLYHLKLLFWLWIRLLCVFVGTVLAIFTWICLPEQTWDFW